MGDVRGRFLGLPHSTTPATVATNKNIKMSSFKSSENIQKKDIFVVFSMLLVINVCFGAVFALCACR